jgi:transcription elongation factor Elf1
MARDRVEAGTCTECGSGTVVCTHNTFVDESVKIDSWEHRCGECGHRQTQAVRAGGDEGEPQGDPTTCPFCGRNAP